MSRFKEGDKVIHTISKEPATLVRQAWPKLWRTAEHFAYWPEKHFELESIYNSPLYKALN